ncbi:MAG: hypothetical protein K1X72_19100 [Pyrinomonadaceae bacterium]|nr:hypothetical protein [Pyrinomonadaceae bacterium]
MSNLAETFQNLADDQKRLVHLELCRNALRIWQEYASQFEKIDYVEGIVGTYQIVDKCLPKDAFEAVVRGHDEKKVDWRYAEPISAMQDDYLEFPDHIEFAYYAIYNLFNKYILCLNIDDWLICNQALSAENNLEIVDSLLTDAILKSL